MIAGRARNRAAAGLSPSFERYRAAGRAGRNAPGLLLLGLALAAATVIVGASTAFRFFGAWAPPPAPTLLASLFGLALVTPLLAALLPSLHDRPVSSVLGAEGRLKPGALAVGALFGAAYAGAGLALGVAFGLIELVWIPGGLRQSGLWLALMAIAAVLIPLQAASEELVFRGYLIQGLAARWRSAIIWGGAPTVLFAAIHHPGGPVDWGFLVNVLAFGAAATALVWRTGGLSHVIGFHTANNWVALLAVDPPAGAPGLGPVAVRYASGASLAATLLDLVLLTLACAALWRWATPERAAD